MWKKPKNKSPEFGTPSVRKSPMEQLKERAIIGPSINIKGTLAGEGDLMIQGQVEGTIDLKNNNITVGRNGRIKADIYGKVISIEGKVEGDLFGDEKIVLRQSGVVRGNMTAPRVNLEDGAKFKGSIDMDARGEGRQPILKEAPTKQSESSKVGTGDSGKQDAKKDEAESGQRGLDLETDTSSSRA